MSRPLLITFEGPEGGGKTTQIELLRKYLEHNGHSVLVTRQPGGDPVGIELRKIMLDIGRTSVSPRAELLMMMADRSQSVDSIIRPHLSKNGVVICDRYIDSSVAYQGGGRGIDKEWIDQLNQYAIDGILPDLTFLLDIDPAQGIARQSDRNKMEELDFAFHCRVRKTYVELAAQHPGRIRLLDASDTIANVSSRIITLLNESGLLC